MNRASSKHLIVVLYILAGTLLAAAIIPFLYQYVAVAGSFSSRATRPAMAGPVTPSPTRVNARPWARRVFLTGPRCVRARRRMARRSAALQISACNPAMSSSCPKERRS